MLKTRIIPTLLLKEHTLVKDRKFASERPIGTLLPAIRVFNSRDVDELTILDVAATRLGRGPDLKQIEHVASEVRVPLAIGGGVRTVADFETVLHAGADKIVVNSAVFCSPSVVADAADRFGSQCVVVSVDVARDSTGRLMCFSHCGTKPRDVTLAEHIRAVEALGAGELLVCSIERDGEMSGYDQEILDVAASVATIPVIASGGCGTYEHMFDALVSHGASAVAAGSMFQFTEQTPLGARSYLADRGLNVRDSEI
jgi:cyclase